MESISNILNEHSPIKSAMAGLEKSRIIRKNWESVMGKLASQIEFESFHDGALTCCTANMMWVNEIKFHQSIILNNCQKLFGKKIVKTIKVIHKSTRGKHQINKTMPIPAQSRSTDSKSLYDKIVEDEAYKKANGYVLCKHCQDLWVKPPQTACIYCRSQLKY